jgi:hypothetical protein
MGQDGPQGRHASRRHAKAWLTFHSSTAWARAAGFAGMQTGAVRDRAVCVYVIAGRTDDATHGASRCGGSCQSCWHRVPGPSTHAPPSYGVLSGEHGPRYARDPTLPGAQKHSAYSEIYGTGGRPG